jgi:hypothetical protein
MFCVIRPDFEVVKEGRILHFVSGYSRFEFASIIFIEKSIWFETILADGK